MSEFEAASPDRGAHDVATAVPFRPARDLWAGIRAVLGTVLGLLPHLMHHVGLLAGAAILTGVVGNSVLYIVGLLLTIPLLRRLHRRFGTPLAPALGAVVFTALFLVSALVIGPAISGTGGGPPIDPEPLPALTWDTHSRHH